MNKKPMNIVKKNSWPANIGKHLKNRFIAGLVALVPLMLTVFVLRVVWKMVKRILVPLIDQFLPVTIPGLDLVLLVILIYIIGVFATFYFGRQFVKAFENLLDKIPLARDIYGYAKNMVEIMAVPEKMVFKKAVLVAWPSPGMWTPGFVTAHIELKEAGRIEERAAVFVPTPPNPVNGWTVFALPCDLRDTNLTSEEVVHGELSGGFVMPTHIRLDPWKK
jgi:uncharacterized membrane protein